MTTIQGLPQGALVELTIPNPKTFMEKAAGFLGNRTVQAAAATVAVAATAAFIASNPNLLSGANQSTALMLHPTANPAPMPSIDLSALPNMVITVDLNASLNQATSAVKTGALFQGLQASFDRANLTAELAANQIIFDAPLLGTGSFVTPTTQVNFEASSFPLEGLLVGAETVMAALPGAVEATKTVASNLMDDPKASLSSAFEATMTGAANLHAQLPSREATIDTLTTGGSKAYSALEHFSSGAGMLFSTIGSVVGGALSSFQEAIDPNSCPNLKSRLSNINKPSARRISSQYLARIKHEMRLRQCK